MQTLADRAQPRGTDLQRSRREQFAEMVYLMVMSEDEMCRRVRALARRYGMADVDTRAEVLRYFQRVGAGIAYEPRSG